MCVMSIEYVCRKHLHLQFADACVLVLEFWEFHESPFILPGSIEIGGGFVPDLLPFAIMNIYCKYTNIEQKAYIYRGFYTLPTYCDQPTYLPTYLPTYIQYNREHVSDETGLFLECSLG